MLERNAKHVQTGADTFRSSGVGESAQSASEIDSTGHATMPASATRLRSLDALRGFDMFWIVGGAPLVASLATYTEWQWLQWFSGQLHHAPFIGFKLLDLVFPLFLFIAGVAVPYSLGKKLEQGASKSKLVRKTMIRAVLLVLLGVIYNGLLQWQPLESTRLCSVLGFIGVSYFFAVLIYLNSDLRQQAVWIIAILLGYWAVLMWTPVPGVGAGVFTPKGAITGYVDRAMLPWAFNTPHYDSQGILVHIPAIATALFGVVTGALLHGSKLPKTANAIGLLCAGVVLCCVGLAWGWILPISKELWSSSFVVWCAGLSLLLLGLFYLIIDAFGLNRWSFFFIVIGMNSITIYLGVQLVNFHYTSDYLFGGLVEQLDEPLRPIAAAAAYIVTWWLVLFYLVRKKIFISV